MNELSDMIKHLYDFFQQKYGLDTGGLGPGSLFLAFERTPTTVSPTDFKLSPQDTSFNNAVVLQHGADIVNFMAEIDSEGFIRPRGDISPSVDEQYSLLVNGASSDAPSDAETALFLQLKGQARQHFEDSRQNMNFTDFWPAAFTPQFWFNDQDPTLWSSYSHSTSQSTETHPSGPVVLGDWRWRLVTPEMKPRWQMVTEAQALPTFELAKNAPLTTDLSQIAVLRPADAGRVTPSMSPVQPATHLNIDLADSAVVAGAASRLTSPASPVLRESSVLSARMATSFSPQGGETSLPDLQKAQLVTLRIKDAAFKQLVQALPEEHVSSSSFSITFDYCLVNVARSWLSANFLSADHWYQPGLASGALAAGQYETTSRPFAFLPAKFLLVRNLRISAQWSQEDRVSINSAACLGPFSLHEKSFDGITIFAPGMQIIAWFCQIMPVLPPTADPALA